MSIDRMAFYELCNKAGFVKNTKIDVAELAKFYGKSERTIYRMLAAGTYHDMNIKLLKMHVLNIELEHRLELLTAEKKFPFVTRVIAQFDEYEIRKFLNYPSIKKRAMKIALNLVIIIYKKL